MFVHGERNGADVVGCDDVERRNPDRRRHSVEPQAPRPPLSPPGFDEGTAGHVPERSRTLWPRPHPASRRTLSLSRTSPRQLLPQPGSGRERSAEGVEEGKEEGLGRGQGPCNALETRAGRAIMPSKPMADKYRFDSRGGIASHNHAGATPPFSPQQGAPSC